MQSLLQKMHASNTHVIYLDETMFTFRSEGWALNRERIRINDSELKVTTLAVIAAISEEHGLIDYIVHPKAINAEVLSHSSTRSLKTRTWRLCTVLG